MYSERASLSGGGRVTVAADVGAPQFRLVILVLVNETDAAGTVLRDGTRFADLIDPEHYEVSLRLLSDPEIYRLELERIFARSWNFLGHESEVPNPGDYVMRHIGEDPVIVTRDSQGQINVLLNVCAHRGMMVCRAEGGKGTQFKCPYHGWTFSNTGRFLGAPVARERMHGAFRTREELSLRKARVELFAGMVFANWDESAPPLDDWLGDIKWYYEMMFDRTPGGLEVLGPPQRFIINANWKCPSEQHNVDGYHTISLHASLVELSAMAGGDDSPTAQLGVNVSANGHALRCIDQREPYVLQLKDKIRRDMTPEQRLAIVPPPGLTADDIPALTERFGEDRLRMLAEFPPSVGGLFPNVGLFSLAFPSAEGMAPVIMFHSFVPKGPDKFEFLNWYAVEKRSSQRMRDLARRTMTLGFGTSGFIESDDADTWPQMTQTSRGVMGAKEKIRYGALTGEGTRPADWPGPGFVYDGFNKDDCQWRWWLRYFELMTEGV